MISEPSRYYAVELQALPPRIGQIRRIVAAHLRHWQLDDLVDPVELGVTELLTNVHRHAQPDKECTVELELLLDRLTVSVRDNDPRIPVASETPAEELWDGPDALATSGRGLAIVGALSDSWGVRPGGVSGKVVWFTLTAPPCAGGPAVTGAETGLGFGLVPLAPVVSYGRLAGVPLSTPTEAPALAASGARA
ncbi:MULTISPECIES: ATP-binding protein [Streptomyces]|uniref:ATP-binding protein n=2 Tax=Streptomyces TaxID=1883 RepID=A0ABU4KGN2_9ACTN|nr:ATP-binding protein [Streptomyces roseolus]MDX2296955.1 ATP-binding protein [Streptomyces roseolus]